MIVVAVVVVEAAAVVVVIPPLISRIEISKVPPPRSNTAIVFPSALSSP